MTVPEGFTVELVASEPDIVNPVAMTFDERGRIWITESLEYPRQRAGPGPRPDQDSGRHRRRRQGRQVHDLRRGAEHPLGHRRRLRRRVGRQLARHSVPAGHRRRRQGRQARSGRHRLRPRRHARAAQLAHLGARRLAVRAQRRLQSQPRRAGRQARSTSPARCFAFIRGRASSSCSAEGTSNPWGIAWDTEGSAFVSACVIDHLWHLTETGYYIRQGGPYPPFTWPIGSIVKHKHQKAAYCGIHFFDSDAYPAEYRERLYMGNIHGNCINVDVLARDGSTYAGHGRARLPRRPTTPGSCRSCRRPGPTAACTFSTGTTGTTAIRTPAAIPTGIDRLKGRLYRVRYQRHAARRRGSTWRRKPTTNSIERLGSPNVYYRDIAQRLLCERATPETRVVLERLVLDEHRRAQATDARPVVARRHGVAAVGISPGAVGARRRRLSRLGRARGGQLRQHRAGDSRPGDRAGRRPGARRSLAGGDRGRKTRRASTRMPLLLDVLAASGDDPLIPHIVWQNLHPLLDRRRASGSWNCCRTTHCRDSPAVGALMPRLVDRVAGQRQSGGDRGAVAALVQRFAGQRRAT